MDEKMTTIGVRPCNRVQRTRSRAVAAVVRLIFIAALTPVAAQDTQKQESSSEPKRSESLRTFVPDTVSEGWRSVFETFPDPTQAPTAPGPTDIEGWNIAHSVMEKTALELSEQAVRQFGVSVAGKDFGGVPVLEVTPKGWNEDGKVLVYAHGGAYTMFSARSTLPDGGPAGWLSFLRRCVIFWHGATRIRTTEYRRHPCRRNA